MERGQLARIGRQAKTSNENRRKQLGKTTRPVVEGQSCLAVGKPSTPAPAGWEWRRLTDIARLESGHTPSKSKSAYWNGDFAWIGISDARQYDGDVIEDTKKHITQAGLDNSSARLLPPRTVCLSRTASIGYCVIMGREMATSQDFINWVCSDELYPEFLQYVFRAEHDALLRFGEGSTHQTIYFKDAKRFHVCVPDVPTQKRIVAQLDSLLARREKAEHYLTAIPPLIDQFRQSVLARAFTGELTADWRKNHPDVEPASELLERVQPKWREQWIEGYARNLSDRAAKRAAKKGDKWTAEDDAAYMRKKRKKGEDKFEWPSLSNTPDAPAVEWFAPVDELGWEKAPLEGLCHGGRGIPYGIVKTGDETPGGIPTVRCGDIKQFRIDVPNLKKVAPEISAQYARTLLEGGEVLLSIRGTVGEIAVAGDDMTGMNISREVAMIPVVPEVNSKFIMYLIASPVGQRILTGHTKGVAQRGINLGDLRSVPVPLPPRAEQDEIVRRVEERLSEVRTIERSLVETRELNESLGQSVLSDAFAVE